MAFTLQIRQKKLFGKTVLDITSLAHACGFCYGSNNDFYILQENEQANGTAVFIIRSISVGESFLTAAEPEKGIMR